MRCYRLFCRLSVDTHIRHTEGWPVVAILQQKWVAAGASCLISVAYSYTYGSTEVRAAGEAGRAPDYARPSLQVLLMQALTDELPCNSQNSETC